jgi:hypothetical protein
MVNDIPDDYWRNPVTHNDEEDWGNDCEIVTCPYIKKDGTVCGYPGCLGYWKDLNNSKPDMTTQQLIMSIVRSYQRHNGDWVKVANEVFIVYRYQRVLHAHHIKDEKVQGRNTSHILKDTLERATIPQYQVVTRVIQHPKVPQDKLEDMGI